MRWPSASPPAPTPVSKRPMRECPRRGARTVPQRPARHRAQPLQSRFAMAFGATPRAVRQHDLAQRHARTEATLGSAAAVARQNWLLGDYRARFWLDVLGMRTTARRVAADRWVLNDRKRSSRMLRMPTSSSYTQSSTLMGTGEKAAPSLRSRARNEGAQHGQAAREDGHATRLPAKSFSRTWRSNAIISWEVASASRHTAK